MKYQFLVLLAITTMIFLACKQKSEVNSTSVTQNNSVTSSAEEKERVKVYQHEIMDSKEFEDYFTIFFKQSDSNSSKNLIHVNKFMSENEIPLSLGICSLLDNDKVKSDSIVYNYFNKRCKFIEARTRLMGKFNIDSDSVKKLILQAIEIKRENK